MSARFATRAHGTCQDRDAPNLQIASIVETFDALGMTEAFRARLEDLRSRVRTAWSNAPSDF